MAIKMVNIENTDEVMSALLNTLADLRREKQRYADLYQLALKEIVDLKEKLAKTEVNL